MDPSSSKPDVPSPYIKVCTSCYAALTTLDFHVSKTFKDGYKERCKKCRNELIEFYRFPKFRKRPRRIPTTLRNVKRHNLKILDLILSSNDFTLLAFVPHTDLSYTVRFTGWPDSNIRKLSLLVSGDPYKAFSFPNENLELVKSQILDLLKSEKIRLELTDIDMINSKSQIYYLK